MPAGAAGDVENPVARLDLKRLDEECHLVSRLLGAGHLAE